jgi:hypothetical protein
VLGYPERLVSNPQQVLHLPAGKEIRITKRSIWKLLRGYGWGGVWVDTYGRKNRTTWGDGGVGLPQNKLELLQEIYTSDDLPKVSETLVQPLPQHRTAEILHSDEGAA